MAEATVKGQLMLGIKRHLREKYRDEGYAKFMQNQTAEHYELWEKKPILPVSRIPAHYLSVRMRLMSSFGVKWPGPAWR